VRVDEFRSVEEGDTAKLSVYGLPPAKPLPIAPAAPRLGETVTSIGFPGLNIGTTDGVNVAALLSGGKTPAEVLQNSRLQPVNTSGTIMSRQFRQGVAVYQVNADLGGGMSGGPTINARGEVLGVNSMMTAPFFGQNFNVITDTGMLREFLGHPLPQAPAPAVPPATNAPVEPTSAVGAQPGPAATSGSGSSTGWALPVVGLGGGVLGGLATWRLHRSRRGASTARPGDTADTQPAPATP
jgi:hypothetical protein